MGTSRQPESCCGRSSGMQESHRTRADAAGVLDARPPHLRGGVGAAAGHHGEGEEPRGERLCGHRLAWGHLAIKNAPIGLPGLEAAGSSKLRTWTWVLRFPHAQVVNQRMAKLKPQGSAAHRRPVAEVIIKYDAARRSIVCDGHLDEVVELRRGGQKMAGGWRPRRAGQGVGFGWEGLMCAVTPAGGRDQTGAAEDSGSDWPVACCLRPTAAELRDAERKLVLVEGELLGEGAFSRVCKVTGESGLRRGLQGLPGWRSAGDVWRAAVERNAVCQPWFDSH